MENKREAAHACLWRHRENVRKATPTLFTGCREKSHKAGWCGGLEWGKVKDNFHLKKPKYLFIVKFDNLILCNCRRRGKKNPQALESPRRKPEDAALAEFLRPRPLLGWGLGMRVEGGQEQKTVTAEGSSLLWALHPFPLSPLGSCKVTRRYWKFHS